LIEENTFNVSPAQRIDGFLSQIWQENFSRSRIQKFIRDGKIKLNGKICNKPAFQIQGDVTIELNYEEPKDYLIARSDKQIPILFEDPYLAIIHKPTNMTVHPGAGTKDDTLVHYLLGQFDELSEVDDKQRPGIVHRLDRETEGLMVIAKKTNVHRQLSELFENRKIQKKYEAWLWGHSPEVCVAEGFIGRHRSNRKKMVYSPEQVNPTYKSSEMSITTLEQTNHFSRVTIDLKTGRTHQIRATCSYLKIPVVGDEMYSRIHRRQKVAGFSNEKVNDLNERGLLLIASGLAFEHPVTHEKLSYSLPLPDRFLNL